MDGMSPILQMTRTIIPLKLQNSRLTLFRWQKHWNKYKSSWPALQISGFISSKKASLFQMFYKVLKIWITS